MKLEIGLNPATREELQRATQAVHRVAYEVSETRALLLVAVIAVGVLAFLYLSREKGES
jgi:hypothetical protein